MIGLTKKTADVDSPQAVFAGAGGSWEYRVLKTWQNDDAKPYARWFMAVKSPMTWGSFDVGDTYVRDVVLNAELVQVGGREPTLAELDEVAELRELVALVADQPW